MMRLQPYCSPYFDHNWRSRPYGIAGFRQGWEERLVANCPDHPVARQGYLAALHSLRSNFMPGAFERVEDVARFQWEIAKALRALDEDQYREGFAGFKEDQDDTTV